MGAAMTEQTVIDEMTGHPLGLGPIDLSTRLIASQRPPSLSAKLGVPDVVLERTAARGETPAPAPAASFLSGLSLFGVAQLLNLERKTCMVEVTAPSGRGRLIFLNGEVVDAETGELTGDGAVQRLLTWDAPTLWIYETAAPTRMTVTRNVTQLLLDVLRREDEQRDEMVNLDVLTLDEQPVAPSITLADDVTARLDGIAALRGVLAVAIVDAATRVIRERSVSALDFDLETAVAEVVDLAAAQVQAAPASDGQVAQIEEIRVVGRRTEHLVRPLDSGWRAYLYVALDPNLSNPMRTIRRLTRQAASLTA